MDIEKIRKEKPIKELLNFSILNFDKPSGPPSFEVINKIKKKLKLSKTAHFGTLDPGVTGVLPVALGRACRLSGYFLKKEKEYVGVMQLHQDIGEEKLKEEIKSFIGKIMQLPPIKSNVKREEREREIYEFEILELEARNALFRVRCEAGTYIRKLVHDLGLKIGGAHMIELRRTRAGIFSEEDKEFVNFYEFEKAVEQYEKGEPERLREILIPAEIITRFMPVVQIKSQNLKQILIGKPIFKNDLEEKYDFKEGENIAVFWGEKFIETAKIERKGNIVARPEFVMN